MSRARGRVSVAQVAPLRLDGLIARLAHLHRNGPVVRQDLLVAALERERHRVRDKLGVRRQLAEAIGVLGRHARGLGPEARRGVLDLREHGVGVRQEALELGFAEGVGAPGDVRREVGAAVLRL